MAMMDQHFAYFDAIVGTCNALLNFRGNSKAKKGVMVPVNTAIEARLFVRPFLMKKNTEDNHLYLQYAPSKQGEFLLHRRPLSVF